MGGIIQKLELLGTRKISRTNWNQTDYWYRNEISEFCIRWSVVGISPLNNTKQCWNISHQIACINASYCYRHQLGSTSVYIHSTNRKNIFTWKTAYCRSSSYNSLFKMVIFLTLKSSGISANSINKEYGIHQESSTILENSWKLSIGRKTNFLWRIILNLFGLWSHDSAVWNSNLYQIGPKHSMVRRRFRKWRWQLGTVPLSTDSNTRMIRLVSNAGMCLATFFDFS